MKLVSIDEENFDEFAEAIDMDIAENIGRKYYRGLGLKDDSENIKASMIWEYKNVNDEADTKAELMWLAMEDVKYAAELFKNYREDVKFESVKESFFDLPIPDEIVSEAINKQGFVTRENESRDVYTTVGEVAKLSLAQRRPPSYIISLYDLTVKQYRQGVISCLYKGKKGMMEDLSAVPMGWYEQDISCAVRTDDEMTGFLLVHKFPSGLLMPVLLYASGPNAKMDLLNLIRFAIRSAAAEYGPDTKILIRRHNQAVKALSDKLFPDKKGKMALFGKRKED